jgi:hypothetical protein
MTVDIEAGSTLLPRREVGFVIGHLFRGLDGRAMAERIDRRLDRLPGQGGLHLAARALAEISAEPRC